MRTPNDSAVVRKVAGCVISRVWGNKELAHSKEYAKYYAHDYCQDHSVLELLIHLPVSFLLFQLIHRHKLSMRQWTSPVPVSLPQICCDSLHFRVNPAVVPFKRLPCNNGFKYVCPQGPAYGFDCGASGGMENRSPVPINSNVPELQTRSRFCYSIILGVITSIDSKYSTDALSSSLSRSIGLLRSYR